MCCHEEAEPGEAAWLGAVEWSHVCSIAGLDSEHDRADRAGRQLLTALPPCASRDYIAMGAASTLLPKQRFRRCAPGGYVNCIRENVYRRTGAKITRSAVNACD